MENPFLYYPGKPSRPYEYGYTPHRVYARLDKIEYEDEQPLLFFDAMDGDWFDGESGQIEPRALHEWWQQNWGNARLFVVEVAVKELPAIIDTVVDKAKWETEEDETSWFTLNLDQAPGAALLYPYLYAEGRPISIRGVVRTSSEKITRLDK